MPNELRVDYQGLDQVSRRFAAQSESIQQAIQAVKRDVSQLQNGGWLGGGSQAFFAEINEDALPSLLRLQQALAEASQVVNEMRRFIQQAEKEASNPFRIGNNV